MSDIEPNEETSTSGGAGRRRGAGGQTGAAGGPGSRAGKRGGGQGAGGPGGGGKGGAGGGGRGKLRAEVKDLRDRVAQLEAAMQESRRRVANDDRPASG
ncbi:MAG: hypothetical protein WKF82_11600 [Nocardioidaceae bacterium]